MMTRLKALYTPQVEDACVRLLYFFNTINTYYLMAAVTSFVAVNHRPAAWLALPVILAAVGLLVRLADFYPLFLLCAGPGLLVAAALVPSGAILVGKVFVVNTIFFLVVMTALMSLPESIVARDPIRIVWRKLGNALITVAPTTVSFSMSVGFGTYLGAALGLGPELLRLQPPAAVFWISSVAGSLLAFGLRPRTFVSKFHLPPPATAHVRRVVVLNIDGCRMDVMRALRLPRLTALARQGASFPGGLTTVYRALTNPAFASILTAAPPEVHGVRDNNLGQSIRVEGLPDLVPTILYGSMHVKHFSKPGWETRIVSLPAHSVHRADAVMQQWILDDLVHRKEVRLFVADYSEADFLAHAYGSRSAEYCRGLRHIDRKIGEVVDFLKARGLDRDTVVIVCSDHGVVAIDHSYLLFDAEKYVPFVAVGPGIRRGLELKGPASIMDIGNTIAYLLGIAYPAAARGRAFVEILADPAAEAQRRHLVATVNLAYYEELARAYDRRHVEVVEGDHDWWLRQFKKAALDGSGPLRVLDFGCGTGFAGQVLTDAGIPVARYLGYDLSPAMVTAARVKRMGPAFLFSHRTEDIERFGPYDVICINSVLHHLSDVAAVTRSLTGLLRPGGWVIGAHEPNRSFFAHRAVRGLAAVYKRLGGGFAVPPDRLARVNRRLRPLLPGTPALTAEGLLQTVENHSPVEQSRYGIDPQRGFGPQMLCQDFFPGFAPHTIETYTTAFVRPGLNRVPGLNRLGQALFMRFFGTGNLLRYVLQRPAAAAGTREPS